MCGRRAEEDLCADGRPAFFGQLNHDVYLYVHHFARLARRGVYLDLASNHAKLISNTYWLDTCLGWDGVCVEANERYFPELRRWRTCDLVTSCVSDRAEEVTFLLYEGLSGVAETNKNAGEFERWRKKPASTTLTCVVLGDELKSRGQLDIDYLSLDLEGHELKALMGIDWTATRISVISLEAAENSTVAAFLVGKGYTRHLPTQCTPGDVEANCITGDEIYLAPGVEWGRPV
jgi:hypothetical protein